MKPIMLLLSLTFAVVGAAEAESLRTGVIDGQIWVENAEHGMDLNIRIATPAGEVFEFVERARDFVTLNFDSYLPELADGHYNYEVSVQPPVELLVTRDGEADFGLPAEAFGGVTPAPDSRAHGQFEVVGGHLFAPDKEE